VELTVSLGDAPVELCGAKIYPRAIPHDTVNPCSGVKGHDGNHHSITVIRGLRVEWSGPKPHDPVEPCWCCGEVHD
jgi:hypothetical protein